MFAGVQGHGRPAWRSRLAWPWAGQGSWGRDGTSAGLQHPCCRDLAQRRGPPLEPLARWAPGPSPPESGRAQAPGPGSSEPARTWGPRGPSPPASAPATFHEEPVDVGALPGRRGHVLAVLLGHLHGQAHLVQRPLVLPGHGLHDGREERLGVEEAGQPHGRGQHEVRGPGLKLLQRQSRAALARPPPGRERA